VQAVETNKLGLKFNIHINNTLERMKLVANESINRFVVIGLTTSITQLNMFSLSKEKFMFSQKKCQLTLLQGVNLHFGYYCTYNFIVHGAQKLRMVNNIDFFLHKNEF
jgi:hypothetical protein